MTPEKLKRMMDACYQAKRIRDLLPTLPEGVTPSYIHFLDILQTLAKQNEPVKVSDLSDALKLPRPGVSRTVKDMVAGGYLQKIASEEDGRVTFLQITEKARLFPRNMTAGSLLHCPAIWRYSRMRTQTA